MTLDDWTKEMQIRGEMKKSAGEREGKKEEKERGETERRLEKERERRSESIKGEMR